MSRRAVPELMGAAEVATELGVAVQNLGFIAGLPEPVQTIRASRLWVAEDIRTFARGYEERRQARRVKAA